MVAKTATQRRLRLLSLVVVTLVTFAAFLLTIEKRRSLSTSTDPNVESATNSVDRTASPIVSPSSLGSTSVIPPPPVSPADAAQTPAANQRSELAESDAGTVNLVIPVAGVKPNQLVDTFADSRSEGRVHDAIDILAPAGTPVVAVADGQIIKLFQSERGGTTIYQASVDRKLIFYYAHLERYADGLVNEKFVKQGETIGYVGDTGNAGAGNFHLHFSVAIVADPKRYWEGTNINPYPLLHR